MKKLLIVVAVLLVLGITGCSPQGSNDSTMISLSNDAVGKGVGFVFNNAQTFAQDLDDANSLGGIVMIPGELDGSGSIPQLVTVAFETRKIKTPIPNIGYQSGSAEEFVSVYGKIAEKHVPKYVVVGNEYNHAYNVQEFIPVYDQAYTTIKTKSPKTIIIPVQQYELNFDTKNYPSQMDCVGVTVYPFIKYATIDDIPSDYLRPLADYSNSRSTPICITETAWPAEYGGEEAQIKYMGKFKELTKDMNIEFYEWGVLYDVNNKGRLWDSTGLIKTDSTKKSSYEAYKNL